MNIRLKTAEKERDLPISENRDVSSRLCRKPAFDEHGRLFPSLMLSSEVGCQHLCRQRNGEAEKRYLYRLCDKSEECLSIFIPVTFIKLLIKSLSNDAIPF